MPTGLRRVGHFREEREHCLATKIDDMLMSTASAGQSRCVGDRVYFERQM
jgi:hypothetical protein